MNFNINNFPLKVSFTAPSSKSDFLRLLFCSVFCPNSTVIIHSGTNDDITAAVNALSVFCKNIRIGADSVMVFPRFFENFRTNYAQIYCGESASLFRFILPVCTRFSKEVLLLGDDSLKTRPNNIYFDILKKHGLDFSSNSLPVSVSGSFFGGSFDFDFKENFSSQAASGILLALPFSGGGSVRYSDNNFSSGYLKLTAKRMKEFGIDVNFSDGIYNIKKSQFYRSSGEYFAEGDWSSAAAVFACAAVSGEAIINGLEIDSLQPDKNILNILNDVGAQITSTKNSVSVKAQNRLAFNADFSLCPDIFPVCAALACLCPGTSILTGISRLRFKESDRVDSVTNVLSSLGADITISENGDSITVNGKEFLDGGNVSSHGDHRVVMAAAVAAKGCKNDVVISDARVINKSFPKFLKIINNSF